ncbi:hypothetical protein [Dactylosporangium sp. CA-139066]|uniref:hypothetical protein n=1 Tax=Dactylosporangium sp. CA-139066 TaxID=3239930 RepID=UPI003D8FFC14
MTNYGVNADRGLLLAIWPAGRGAFAETVATLPAAVSPGHGSALADSLSALSAALWDRYVQAGSMAGDGGDDDEAVLGSGPAWSDRIVALVQRAARTAADVHLDFYDPIEDAAHQVGRALGPIGSVALDDTVLAEVRREVAGVDAAGGGDLAGRARQAVTLSRLDVSPVQVAAADQALRRDPFGSEELFTTLEPTAAAVAAAHWLRAAASVAADMAGIPTVDVLHTADGLEALPHAVAATILEMMSLRCSPREAVIGLVQQAAAVAAGEAADLYEARDAIEQAIRRAETEGGLDEVEHVEPVRLTPLDPRRPSPDLLEQLVDAIRGCWTVYAEYVDSAEDVETAHERQARQAFIDAVRARAADTAAQLAA